MKKRLFTYIMVFAAFVLPVLVFNPPQAVALIGSGAKSEACKGAELSNSAGSSCGQDAAKSTKDIITTVINILSAVGAVMAVIVIIINGIRFVLSSGDSAKIGSARSGIIMALVGLVVVASAQFIVKFVAGKVG